MKPDAMKPDAHAAWLPAPGRGARHGPAAPGRPPCRAGRVTQGGVVVGGIARQPEEDGPQLLTALVHDLEDRARRRPSRPAGPGVPRARGTGSRPLAGPMGRAVGLKSHGSCRSERGRANLVVFNQQVKAPGLRAERAPRRGWRACSHLTPRPRTSVMGLPAECC